MTNIQYVLEILFCAAILVILLKNHVKSSGSVKAYVSVIMSGSDTRI